jgi:hypothetical protein
MPAKNKDNPLRYIFRLDGGEGGTHAWLFYISRKKERVHKYFTDVVYGGQKKALQAALLYREKYLKTFAIDDYTVWRRNIKRRRNTSGIVGVGRYGIRAKSGRLLMVWQATWTNADNKKKARSFSVSLYGEEKAKELACKVRDEGMKEVERILATRRKIGDVPRIKSSL